MTRDTIIIVLLIVLIGLYIFDMYRKEGFMGWGPVNYNTRKVPCDNLTGGDACVVQTVKPKRDIVCNKRFDVVNQNNLDNSNPRNLRRGLKGSGMEMDNISNEMKLKIKNKMVDNGLSFDELDQLSMEQMDMNNMNVQKMDDQMDIMSDDVSYSKNNEKDMHNKRARDALKDNDTLSDVDNELISLN